MGAPRPEPGPDGLPATDTQDGHDAGYRAGYEQAVREWKITAAGMTHLGGPTYAEQDKRRYPPDGRQSWIARTSDCEGAA